MAIAFHPSDWDRVRRRYDAWWEGRLEGPLCAITLGGRDPGRPEPPVAPLSQANCHRLDLPAESVIDALDYALSCQEYLGDSFPFVNFDAFGPGVLAAFLGAELSNRTGSVWFHADPRPLQELHFAFDENNPWFGRIVELYRAGLRRWQGQVLLGTPDLGGVLDVLATFRGTENLLLDLYDEPEQVLRLSGELQAAWHACFNALQRQLQPLNPGYTDWSGIYASTPSYILQCDFSYMIGPEMFARFVLPTLREDCRLLSRAIYHLDGQGQLAHLPALLELPGLAAVQWVPGDGAPPPEAWPQVYQAIQAAGKGLYVLGGLDSVSQVIQALGSARGVFFRTQAATRREAEDFLRRWGP